MELEEPNFEGVTVLRKPDGGRVYLFGTCHVSDSSASQAAQLVRLTRPSAVVVELCAHRAGILTENSSDSLLDSHRAQLINEESVDAGECVRSVINDWTELFSMQYGALEDLSSVQVGVEFRAAAKEAAAVGAPVVFGDRAIELTRLRLKRLTPLYEIAKAALVGDMEWGEKQALARHADAQALQQTSGQLVEAVAQPPGAERDSRLREICTEVTLHARRAEDAAAPGFTDAVLARLLWRFWCKEVISDEDRARLRAALDAFHRLDPLSDLPMSPTMQRVLIDERDLVLADCLRRQPGERVVGVVGKAHVAGISRVWEQYDTGDLTLPDRLRSALQEPPPPVGYLGGALVACAGAAFGSYRSRRVRYVLGGSAVAAGAGYSWLVCALRDRLEFFRRSQAELAAARTAKINQ